MSIPDDLRYLAVHSYFSEPTKDLLRRAADHIEKLSTVTAHSPEFTGAKLRIRKQLLFGFHPDIANLRLLWKEIFGEEIQPGKRCIDCDGSGLKEGMGTICMGCDGTGYEIKPTWMEQHNAEATTKAD